MFGEMAVRLLELLHLPEIEKHVLKLGQEIHDFCLNLFESLRERAIV
jgi:hypothetical protein